MKKKTLTFFLFFLISLITFSQEVKVNYSHSNNDSINNYFKKVHKLYLESFTGKNKSDVNKLLKNRDKYFINKISDSIYQFDHEIENYLKETLQNIYDANSSIHSENFKFFLKNEISPNASCYGNGIFEVNMGLFHLLESQDELAFILCHEIAHYYLEHSKSAIINHIALQNSKETKEQIRDINKLEYGKNRALFELINNFNYKVLNHSKKAEIQADSLGYILFNNTKFKLNGAISSLQKLGSISEMIFNTSTNIDSIFNLKNYPFKNFWISEKKGMFSVDEKINEFGYSSDTIKTHPAIPLRIQKLQSLTVDSKDSGFNSSDFNTIKSKVLPKIYQLTLDSKRYDLSMYLLINYRKNNFINQEEFIAKMSSILIKIYHLKKDHSLGKYIPLVRKFTSEKELDKIRKFINTIEVSEIRKLGLHFCLENFIESNEEFNANLTDFKTINKL